MGAARDACRERIALLAESVRHLELDLDALAQEQHFSDYSHPSPAGREAMRGAVADFVRAQLDGAKRP